MHWETKQIDDELCDELLSSYHNNPLLKAIELSDARSLLTSALMATTPVDEAGSFEGVFPAVFQHLDNYLKTTEPDAISIPMLLLKGSILYIFPSKSFAPLTNVVPAPWISYYVPFAHDAQTVHPVFASGPDSVGIIFDPNQFKKTTYRNPQMFDVILEDRERLMSMLLKWGSIHSASSPGEHVARYLLAVLAERRVGQAVINKTQQEIANELALSRATIAKGIAFLYDQGIISTGHGKLLVNIDPLKEYIASCKWTCPDYPGSIEHLFNASQASEAR